MIEISFCEKIQLDNDFGNGCSVLSCIFEKYLYYTINLSILFQEVFSILQILLS